MPLDAKYLLSGFVRYGVCGGSIVQSWNAMKSVYRCRYSWSRGPSVCANTLTVPQERADLAVLHAIERGVLDPQVVEAALILALEQPTQSDAATADRRDHLRTEFAGIASELARYADAVADAGPPDTILRGLLVAPETNREQDVLSVPRT